MQPQPGWTNGVIVFRAEKGETAIAVLMSPSLAEEQREELEAGGWTVEISEVGADVERSPASFDLPPARRTLASGSPAGGRNVNAVQVGARGLRIGLGVPDNGAMAEEQPPDLSPRGDLPPPPQDELPPPGDERISVEVAAVVEMARRAQELAEEGARLCRRDREVLDAKRPWSSLWALVLTVAGFALLILVTWELRTWEW